MAKRPPLPPLPHRGGCACGAVRYRLTARPLAANACHCTDCKRVSGAGAAVFLHMKRDGVVLESGELLRFRRTADSGRQIDIARCAACGTRMWHEPLAVPELVLVSAGTLDDARWVVPSSHIWMRSASADAVVADDAVSFDEGAPDRQILWDRFAALYPES